VVPAHCSGAGDLFNEFPALLAWADRIHALGHGKRREMAPDEALRIARESTPLPAQRADAGEPNHIAPGARVSVTPDDYGFDPVDGEVVASSAHEIAVRREDPQLGDIVVHFPRIGFRVAAEA
jgi:hypothetical protein